MQGAVARSAGSDSADRQVTDHLFELRTGDESRPQQARLIVETGNDGRLQPDRRVAAVQNDFDGIAQFIAHMFGLGRTQSPIAIGGGRGDAAAEGVQQLLRHGMRGHPDADAVLAAGDDVIDVVGLGQDQRQGPGPEFGGQCFGNRRHRGNPAMQVARIVQMHDHRMIGRTAL